jgi:hypothetical protein
MFEGAGEKSFGKAIKLMEVGFKTQNELRYWLKRSNPYICELYISLYRELVLCSQIP